MYSKTYVEILYKTFALKVSQTNKSITNYYLRLTDIRNLSEILRLDFSLGGMI